MKNSLYYRIFLILFSGVILFSACSSAENTVIISPSSGHLVENSAEIDLSEASDFEPEKQYKFGELYNYYLSSGEYGEDYSSLYDLCGKNIKKDDVIFIGETPFVEYNDELYSPGLDFLSNAMIRNSYAGDTESYEFWSNLYISRLNSLCPEIPLFTFSSYCAFGPVFQKQIK